MSITYNNPLGPSPAAPKIPSGMPQKNPMGPSKNAPGIRPISGPQKPQNPAETFKRNGIFKKSRLRFKIKLEIFIWPAK